MGCNCGKNRAAAAARRSNVAATAASAPKTASAEPRRTPMKRTVKQSAPRTAERPVRRKVTHLRYYAISPDGTEERFNTLAEAQTILRRNGGAAAGWRVESRREEVG